MTSAFFILYNLIFVPYRPLFYVKYKKARISTCGLFIFLGFSVTALQPIAELYSSGFSLGQSLADRQRVRVHGL